MFIVRAAIMGSAMKTWLTYSSVDATCEENETDADTTTNNFNEKSKPDFTFGFIL